MGGYSQANIGVHLPLSYVISQGGTHPWRIHWSLVGYCATDGSGIQGQEAYLSECMAFIPRIRRWLANSGLALRSTSPGQ
jgi:hypothetical protein